MAEARRRAEWKHTSSIMALIANCNLDPKAERLTPADFDPYEARRRQARPKEKMPITILRDIFLRDRTVTTKPRQEQTR